MQVSERSVQPSRIVSNGSPRVAVGVQSRHACTEAFKLYPIGLRNDSVASQIQRRTRDIGQFEVSYSVTPVMPNSLLIHPKRCSPLLGVDSREHRRRILRVANLPVVAVLSLRCRNIQYRYILLAGHEEYREVASECQSEASNRHRRTYPRM